LTLHDIASAAGRPIDRLYIAWKLVKREVLPALHVPLPPVLIQALVQRRAGEMKLPWDHVTRLLVAGYTLDNRKLPTVLVGKSPLAIVAALVYLEVPKMTQLEIAKACGVTEVSIRNLVKIVEPLGLVMEGNGDKMK
jgi:transcription initiation factor TFIIIB Brf1 subunit/transcription initiation factor TFIIB